MAAGLNDSRPLGYYVHTHGTGHMQRARRICAHITRPIIMFSAHAAPADLPPHVTFIRLKSDAVDGYRQPSGSMFHYTPYDPAIFARNQQLINAWLEYDIREMYVDVSIEVAMLAKLYGLTVGHALMQGDRSDAAHRYGYQAVDYLLAHGAPQFYSALPTDLTTPIWFSGGISRFTKQPPSALRSVASSDAADSSVDSTADMPRMVVVAVSPKHETTDTDTLLACAEAYPGTSWHILGQHVPTELPNIVSHSVGDDLEDIYQQADLIIGSGGTNTIMEAASMGKPFICIPEPRPFGEQLASAQALERLNAAVYLPEFPQPDDWPELCQRVRQLNLAAFASLVSDDAAARAAQLIEGAGLTPTSNR